MAANESETPDLLALKALEVIGRHDIRFVVVGGAAMALHGIPRSTLDIDIIVPCVTDSILRLFEASGEAGLESTQAGFLKLAYKPELLSGQWITFEDKEGHQLIDVLLEAEAVFNDLLGRAVERKAGSQTLHVASLDDIEAMKKAVGRPLDMSDIALIREVREEAAEGLS